MRQAIRLSRTALILAVSLAMAPLLPVEGKPPLSERPRSAEDLGVGPLTPGLVQLKISTDRTTYRQGEEVRITALLLNEGKAAVTLVQPGDGSRCGWRTPLVGWSVHAVLPDDPPVRRPSRLVLSNGGRCGNINALRAQEVFTLEPGQFKRLNGWEGMPPFGDPGTYRIVLHYKNEPGRAWQGLPLGTHDPKARKQIRNSHPCWLVSNELLVTILKAK